MHFACRRARLRRHRSCPHTARMTDPKRWHEFQDRWARERLEPALEGARAPPALHHPVRRRDRPALHGCRSGRPGQRPGCRPAALSVQPAGRRGAGLGRDRRPRAARRAAVHARHPPHRPPRPAVDDAHVRRLRHGRGHERPLQEAHRRRRHRVEIAYDMPTLYGYDHDEPRPKASSAPAAWRSAPSPTWSSSSRASPSARSAPP